VTFKGGFPGFYHLLFLQVWVLGESRSRGSHRLARTYDVEAEGDGEEV